LTNLAELLSSLRVRILGAIFFIFFLAMGMVLYGVWSYQRTQLVDMTSRGVIQMSEIIVAGLRSSMLQNDKVESMRSIRKILQVADTARISIINDAGRTVMTSDPGLDGLVFDKMIHPSCTICHVAGKDPVRTSSIIRGKGEKYLATVTPIKNEPSCYGCHDREKKNIAILLVETSFSRTAAMLGELAQRIVLTGIFAFFIGVLLLNYIVTRFFTRPLEALQEGFKKVGKGDFSYWVNVNSGGEIGYMADSFNVMSRAIGRFVNEIREKTQEVSAHYTIVDSLSQTIEKKKLKDVVVDLLCSLLEAECVALALAVEKHKNIFEMVKIKRGDNRHYHGYYNTDSGELEMCALIRDDFLLWESGKLSSLHYSQDGKKLLLPLHHENLSMGILCVEKPDGESFTSAEKKIVPVLIHHIAVAFANAQLYDMAITDGLTTLYTKRHFQRKIIDFIENFHATKRGFCLLMLDLDHFKEVNDEYGHPTGDKVLVEIATLIRSHIRHGDLPFRYGGEEFAVLLKGDNVDEAVMIAERVRLEVEKNVLQIERIPPFSKTVSIGVACFPLHFTSGEEIISAADSALYEAKHKGRNQVIVFCNDSGRHIVDE